MKVSSTLLINHVVQRVRCPLKQFRNEVCTQKSVHDPVSRLTLICTTAQSVNNSQTFTDTRWFHDGSNAQTFKSVHAIRMDHGSQSHLSKSGESQWLRPVDRSLHFQFNQLCAMNCKNLLAPPLKSRIFLKRLQSQYVCSWKPPSCIVVFPADFHMLPNIGQNKHLPRNFATFLCDCSFRKDVTTSGNGFSFLSSFAAMAQSVCFCAVHCPVQTATSRQPLAALATSRKISKFVSAITIDVPLFPLNP